MGKTFAPGAVARAILIGFAMLLAACDEQGPGPAGTSSQETPPAITAAPETTLALAASSGIRLVSMLLQAL